MATGEEARNSRESRGFVPSPPMNNLRELTDTLFDTSTPPIEQLEILGKFKKHLLELTGIKGEGEDHRNDINTEAGLAIGTEWAARCLDDLNRTLKFLRGVDQAIHDRLAIAPDRPVEILYAGTGPFATLVFPLLARFTPQQLQLTLVEINDMSFAALQRLFAKPEYSGFARELLHADCTKLELSDWSAIDILLSETMQYSLQREHQVPITQYLVPRLREDVVLIPQEIRVSLATLGPTGGTGEWLVTPYAPLVVLSKKGLINPSTTDGTPGTEAIPQELLIPARADAQGILSLTTDIRVYGEHSLGFNESGLTVAKSIHPDGESAKERIFKWYYGYQPEPGIVWEIREA